MLAISLKFRLLSVRVASGLSVSNRKMSVMESRGSSLTEENNCLAIFSWVLGPFVETTRQRLSRDTARRL